MMPRRTLRISTGQCGSLSFHTPQLLVLTEAIFETENSERPGPRICSAVYSFPRGGDKDVERKNVNTSASPTGWMIDGTPAV